MWVTQKVSYTKSELHKKWTTFIQYKIHKLLRIFLFLIILKYVIIGTLKICSHYYCKYKFSWIKYCLIITIFNFKHIIIYI
jgi:hypothetical protein